MDERDFQFWRRQAQVERLTGQLVSAEAFRIAQADKKDWVRETKRIESQIKELQWGKTTSGQKAEKARQNRERTLAAMYAQGKG